MVRYCHNCGNEIPENEKFCSKCGQRAIDLDPSQIKKDFDENVKTNFNSSDSQNNDSKAKGNSNNQKSSKRKNKKKRFSNAKIIFVTLIILILLFGIATMKFSPFEKNYVDNYGAANVNQSAHFTIDIEDGVYLYGLGSSKLIDSDYSVIDRYENFTVSGYEDYEVILNTGDWYYISIYKVDFKNIAKDTGYYPDVDEDGNAYIGFNPKGKSYGYFINIPDSSDNSTYQTLEFLESIFYY